MYFFVTFPTQNITCEFKEATENIFETKTIQILITAGKA